MLKALAAQRSRPTASGRLTVLWATGAVVLAVAMRVPFIRGYAFPDEGGMLLVARYWHAGGPQLYGRYFLDRPPLLELFWRFADHFGGVHAGRWLATGGVVVLVASAAWAGYLVGGHRGSRWSALVTAALAATPLLGVKEVNGELLGAPAIMLSCALTLTAARIRTRPAAQIACAFGAGLAASAGLLFKQNLAGGLVFAAVLVLVAALTRRWPTGTVLRVLVPGVVGAALPLAATAYWAATSGPGLRVLWYTLYGFRVDAARVIADGNTAGPGARLSTLILLSIISGLVPLLLAYLWLARHRIKERDPVTWALVAMLVVGVVGVALGASYWSHYLIALIPSAALAAAAMPALVRARHVWVRPLLAGVVASSVVVVLVAMSPFSLTSALHRVTVAIAGRAGPSQGAGAKTGGHSGAGTTAAGHVGAGPGGRAGVAQASPAKVSASMKHRSESVGGDGPLITWLRKADRPGDSGFVAYGHANIIEAAKLRPPDYPYMWSLPLRVLDPHLSLLTNAVTSRSAPTWIIEWMPFNAFHIDPQHAFAKVVRQDYNLVGKICGAPIYVRDSVSRSLPSLPRTCQHG